MFGQKDISNSTDVAQTPSAPAVPSMPVAPGLITPSSPLDTPIQMPASTDPFAHASLGTAPSVPMPATNPVVSTPVISVNPTAPATPSAPSMPAGEPTNIEDLARMKQEALKHLQPLVGSLQQSPEEEFRTLMMMIQATDDKTMLKEALDAAKKIKDDKIRAQAMLDVINEINYFTQTSMQEEN